MKGSKVQAEDGSTPQRFNDIFANLEFLVVQDLFTTTETARLAHLVLPAAGWGEKEGTFINSERRFGLVKKVARAPGQALADFHIFRLIAQYWGCEGLFREWTSPQAVFQILKRLSAGRPCDITGIKDYRHLDAEDGIQWPWPASSAVEPSNHETVESAAAPTPQRFNASTQPPRGRRLFEDGRFYHADGRAKFLFEPPRQLPEQPDTEYPFILLTGRGSSSQWHTLTRTNKSEILRRLAPAALQVEIHPDDARRMGAKTNSRLRIVSRRGAIEATALVTATVQRGQVYLPMHHAATNQITLPVFDPYSRQPGYKFCAVRLEKTR